MILTFRIRDLGTTLRDFRNVFREIELDKSDKCPSKL